MGSTLQFEILSKIINLGTTRQLCVNIWYNIWLLHTLNNSTWICDIFDIVLALQITIKTRGYIYQKNRFLTYYQMLFKITVIVLNTRCSQIQKTFLHIFNHLYKDIFFLELKIPSEIKRIRKMSYVILQKMFCTTRKCVLIFKFYLLMCISKS